MRKIFIVDDVEDNRDFLFYVLTGRYEVTRYARGREVLAGLQTDPPDLILLDLSLPDMTGFDVLKAIRDEAHLRNMPVVAVTAHAMAGDREKCLKAGFTDYVPKPILDLDDLVDTIERHLHPKR